MTSTVGGLFSLNFDTNYIAFWLVLGLAVACVATALFGHAWFLSIGLGFWLAGGWLAQKMINKEDDE